MSPWRAVDFYQHRDDPPEGAPDYGDDFACQIQSLAAGATAEWHVEVVHPATVTYKMWAQVDIDWLIAESNEARTSSAPRRYWSCRMLAAILSPTLATSCPTASDSSQSDADGDGTGTIVIGGAPTETACRKG